MDIEEKNISLSKWPHYSEEEISKVQSVLASGNVNYWTGGEGKKFEEEFSDWCGAKFSIAIANGTLALELALRALNIKPGDEVIVTPRSFIASVSCVQSVGAKPIFVEVDKDSGNITSETISSAITSKTKAVICVHLAGWPCEMSSIMDLSRKHNFYVIEDCAQAHGAKYKGMSVGSIGDIGCWSFCQDKIMSTGGEGGMVTTNDRLLWEKMWSYKDHGKSYSATQEKNNGPVTRWVHESFGTNFRMTEMQSAIGRIQLRRMNKWSRIRRDNAKKLKETCDRFKNLLFTPTCADDCMHAYYKFYTYLNLSALKEGWTREKIIDELQKKGIPSFSGSCPEIYLESAFNNTSFKPKARLPIARKLGETSLVFLVHPTLSSDQMYGMTQIIAEVFDQASV